MQKHWSNARKSSLKKVLPLQGSRDLKTPIMFKGNSQFSRTIIARLEPQIPWTTNKKTRVYDFFGVLESVAWIWRSLGVFPVTIKGPVGMKRYGINKFYAIYSFSIFAMCITNLLYGLRMSFSYHFRHSVPMTAITILIRMIASMLCMTLTNFWRIVRVNELSESLTKIFEQEKILAKIGCRINYESSARIIRAYVWTTLVILLILMVQDFLTVFHTLKSSFIPWVLWMFPLIPQTMDLTIFVFLVGWIGLKFRAINQKIRNVVTRANTSSPKTIVTSNVCAENLRALSKAHYSMCAIGKRVNSIFDWDVIINVATAFIILSTTLYYIFYEVEREGETNLSLIFRYVHWEFIHSAPIIVIVIICNWTSRQGIYAGKLIHEIRVERTDSRLYEAVKSFSLQLHHQKLEFTAGGFFPLNSTLLQTMVGTITTYLVILIQFQPNLED